MGRSRRPGAWTARIGIYAFRIEADCIYRIIGIINEKSSDLND